MAEAWPKRMSLTFDVRGHDPTYCKMVSRSLGEASYLFHVLDEYFTGATITWEGASVTIQAEAWDEEDVAKLAVYGFKPTEGT